MQTQPIRKYKLLLLLLLAAWFIGQPLNSYASHALGAELTYTCIDQNRYFVTLKFYRDCAGINVGNSQVINYFSEHCGLYETLSLTRDTTIDITPLCDGQVSYCSDTTSNIRGIEEHIYFGTLILPQDCSDWVISFQASNRNAAITNLDNPSSQDIYVTTQLNNETVTCNNSPVFLNPASFSGCVGQPIIYNHGVIDPDGDELKFSLANCRQSADEIVDYAGTFSGSNPLLTSLDDPLIIDQITGAITFIPNMTQIAVICIRVEEFRNGIKIGEVVRDIQFSASDCANENNLPEITGPFDFTTQVGIPLCFNIIGSDPDPDNLVMLSSINSPNGTFNPTLPTEFMAVASTQFCWTPTIEDAGKTEVLVITIKDNNCPQGIRTYTFKIEVPPTGQYTYTLDLDNPCTCSNPQNCQIDDAFYFNDKLIIITNPLTSGLSVTVNSSENLYNNIDCINGTATPPMVSTAIVESSTSLGVYEFNFWRLREATPELTIRFDNGPIEYVPTSTFESRTFLLPFCGLLSKKLNIPIRE